MEIAALILIFLSIRVLWRALAYLPQIALVLAVLWVIGRLAS